MKADIKAQWVKDLRSGEFEQGAYSLDQVSVETGKRQQCCLGVLCLQAVRAGVIPEPEKHGSVYLYLDDLTGADGEVTGQSFRQSDILPRNVREWAGLDSDNPEISDGLEAALANDEEGFSFLEIADLIDKNVPAE